MIIAPRRQWWFRTLLVAGVLAGVMGMHGLTTAHAAMPMAASGATSHGTVASHSPATAESPVMTQPSAEGHPLTGGHTAQQACLAILAAAVALLVLLLRRERYRQSPLTSAPRSRGAAAPPATTPRPRALTLHQLSICRT